MLSRLFSVSVDVLLKDELDISGVKEVSTCGVVQASNDEIMIYEGVT